MPLTTLSLQIDQSQSGWLARALRDGVARLRAAGLPAMAEELRRQAAGESDPRETLSRYLRLEQLGGEAPPFHPSAPWRGNCGASGASAHSAPTTTPRGCWNHRYPRSAMHSPVVVGHRAVFGCADGALRCLDVESGEELWQDDEFGHYAWRLTLAAETLLQATNVGAVVGRRPQDGRELWRMTLGGRPLGQIEVGPGGQILLSTNDCHLFCLLPD